MKSPTETEIKMKATADTYVELWRIARTRPKQHREGIESRMRRIFWSLPADERSKLQCY